MDVFDTLNEDHIRFIEAQKMFFVATGGAEGWLNLSPKGLDSLRVMDKNRIVWLNLTGSGNETAAHVQDNPRMTLMLNAFEGPAEILRIFGHAKVIHHKDEAWDELVDLFPPSDGSRQIFDLSIKRVQTSCGYAVPEYTFKKDRDILTKWTKAKGADGMRAARDWQAACQAGSCDFPMAGGRDPFANINRPTDLAALQDR